MSAFVRRNLFDTSADPRYPGDQDRLTIVGATGSGKTHAALWHLSRANYDQKPWIVYDWKRDEFINSLPGAIEISVNSAIPEQPGIYVVHPVPGKDNDDPAVEKQMKEIWTVEDTGVFVDEGYMVAANNESFRLLLTQGRSKHIPMIILSQRPVWMDRFTWSEAEFNQVFRLRIVDDVMKMEDLIPGLKSQREKGIRLDPYYSYYYDSINDDLRTMRPLPDQSAIRATFEAKLSRLKRAI